MLTTRIVIELIPTTYRVLAFLPVAPCEVDTLITPTSGKFKGLSWLRVQQADSTEVGLAPFCMLSATGLLFHEEIGM